MDYSLYLSRSFDCFCLKIAIVYNKKYKPEFLFCQSVIF